jgi:hypothetical protein
MSQTSNRDPKSENPAVVSESRYARSGDVSIAYRVAGEGPFDIVYVDSTWAVSGLSGHAFTLGCSAPAYS